jgi:hypothetical protein
MMIETMTRADLEVTILEEQSLYERFDETRLMASGYSDAEYREIISAWIQDGDECAGA